MSRVSLKKENTGWRETFFDNNLTSIQKVDFSMQAGLNLAASRTMVRELIRLLVQFTATIKLLLRISWASKVLNYTFHRIRLAGVEWILQLKIFSWAVILVSLTVIIAQISSFSSTIFWVPIRLMKDILWTTWTQNVSVNCHSKSRIWKL